MKIPDTITAKVLEFREKFVRESAFGVSIGAIDSFEGTGQKQVETWIEQALLDVRRETIEEEKESKDGAYRERDMLVCALTKMLPAYLARHDDSDKEWEDDWRWIVYIDLPTGQVSWHIHDSERGMFDHLQVKENRWDGHSTERKYERLANLSAILPNTPTV